MIDENPPAGIDVTRPSVARVYDYWLGGKNNFASDRDMGGRMAEVNPALPQVVRRNREFICAAAARAAAAGINQFLDLGSGLPAHPAVHEAAREVIPDARVCYVDIDPAAVIHGEALLADGEGLAAVRADLTEPENSPPGCSRPPRIPGSGTTTPPIWRRCWPGSRLSPRECARRADG